jgi:DNA-binding NarL/FixJ family response regulator
MLWYDKPSVAIFLALIIGLSVMVWLQIEKRKTAQLLTKIKLGTTLEKNEGQAKFRDLSSRQQQVLLLIMEGKSNKEIMTSLHIEQSTLKTHINQIYRIMEIQNRREAKNIDKQLFTNK